MLERFNSLKNILCTSFRHLQVRGMRRGRMPAKHGNKQYYKGTGGGSVGRFKGPTFIIDAKKIRQLTIPSLLDCPFKPYVSHTANKTVSNDAIKTVQAYIDKARAQNSQSS